MIQSNLIKLVTSALPLVLLTLSCANSQSQATPALVGGPCEGCEAVFEFGNKKLTPTDTLPDFHKEGVPIKIEGHIYQPDGKTPARGVILYVYHTNQRGVYAPADSAQGWGKKHGYNRGWVKTDKNGYYAFYTSKPAPYPNRSEPAHIHYTILEPDGKYYYVSSCHFSGDPLLTKDETDPDSPRGGTSGLLALRKEGNLWIGQRDLVLGQNIPGYR